MHRLLERFLNTPAAGVLLVVIAVLGGAHALLHLPSGLLPGLDVPVVNVISHSPGTAAEDMELLITRPIEDRLRTIPGARRVASTSIEGVSQVTAEMEWGTRLTDARQLVQAQLSAFGPDLPTGVVPRLGSLGTTLEEVAGYVVYPAGDPVELRATVQTSLAGRLMGVEGVGRVDVLGGDRAAFIVRLRRDALTRQRLTINDVTEALAGSNLAVAAGFIERGSREYAVRGDSRLQTLADVESVPVIASGAGSILVRDIATVEPGRVPRHYEIHGDAVPAVAVIVSKQPTAGTIDVVRGVDAELARLGDLLPPSTKVRKFYDQKDIIVEAMGSLVVDLMVGAILAAVVLFLFMGTVRATLIVAATIPVVLLATLGLIQVFGQTLNVITLAALALTVGMVVDDAIVVSENIVCNLRSACDRRSAALAGTAQIAGADVCGTLTTVAAFAPLLFLGGIAGIFVRPFGLVVSIALLASLLVSLTFVPMMFGRAGSRGQRRAPGSALLLRLDRSLQRVLRRAFAHRWIVVLLACAMLGLGALASWLGPIRVLPAIDEGALLIEYVMPAGTSLVESNRIGDILEREALAEPDVVTVYRRTGSPEAGLQIEGVNRGELTIKLAPRAVRERTLDEIMDDLRRQYQEIPGVAYLFHQPTQEKMDESLSGLPALFGVTIFGPDLEILVSLAGQVEQRMAVDPVLRNIINTSQITSPQITIRPDHLELARYGLTPAAVFNAAQAGRSGVQATTIIRQRHQTQVLVRVDAPPDATLEGLKGLAVPMPSGLSVPLDRVAEVRIDHMPAAITRLNGQREITILAEVDGSIPAAVRRLQEAFNTIKMPHGFSVAFTGQYQVLQRTVRDIVLIGIAAVILIYLIMTMQLGSWLQPLIILVTAPAALVGAIVLLAITRVGLDISVGMGALTLVGIAVNNAIVLLDCSNRRVAGGQAVRDALQSAFSERLRPIMMTAVTTVLALLPVAVHPGVGSRMFQPFAITVIGGLLSCTAATLVLVPVLAGWSRPRS